MKKPKIVATFINLLWVNIPKDCEIKSVYQQKTLFVSILVGTKDDSILKIRRQYTLEDLKNRKEDLWGLAKDCADEIVHSVENMKN